jgi:hypothetical protein
MLVRRRSVGEERAQLGHDCRDKRLGKRACDRHAPRTHNRCGQPVPATRGSGTVDETVALRLLCAKARRRPIVSQSAVTETVDRRSTNGAAMAKRS